VPGADRVKVSIERTSAIARTPRVLQLEGMFDVPPAERAALAWSVDLPIEDRDWNIGLIVGPSGCGKSTIARELFRDAYVTGYDWPADRSIIDAFPDAMSIKDITLLLSSVGFSSPPSWVRPFGVLSNGEQFRATLARALAEKPALCVFDEFTSVVDRTVGRIGSAAVAKTVRRRKGKFIAVTCHDDVVEWLDPDWVYTPVDNATQWRLLRRRPAIELTIARVHHSAWRLFAHHHYLTAQLNRAAVCFVGFIAGAPVAFHSYLPFVGSLSHGKAMRGHRFVVLPDYQGVGISKAMAATLASMWKALGARTFLSMGHPGQIASVRNENWCLTRSPKFSPKDTDRDKSRSRATRRLIASFEYRGGAMPIDTARALFGA
jgi:ABC-type molybdenum transport system ATPase subunit/photorepair protein PhrA/GNAT superfamily N-acetyltransferase